MCIHNVHLLILELLLNTTSKQNQKGEKFGLKCKWSEIQPLYQLSTLVNTRHVMTQVSEESELCGLVCVPLNGRSFSLSRVNALYPSILLESSSHH